MTQKQSQGRPARLRTNEMHRLLIDLHAKQRVRLFAEIISFMKGRLAIELIGSHIQITVGSDA